MVIEGSFILMKLFYSSTSVPLRYTLKTETPRFAHVFRVCRSGTVVENGLTIRMPTVNKLFIVVTCCDELTPINMHDISTEWCCGVT